MPSFAHRYRRELFQREAAKLKEKTDYKLRICERERKDKLEAGIRARLKDEEKA